MDKQDWVSRNRYKAGYGFCGFIILCGVFFAVASDLLTNDVRLGLIYDTYGLFLVGISAWYLSFIYHYNKETC